MITTFGRDFAMASTLFHRTNTPGKVGRMTQTWVRFDEGWRIVVGHVSVIAEPATLLRYRHLVDVLISIRPSVLARADDVIA